MAAKKKALSGAARRNAAQAKMLAASQAVAAPTPVAEAAPVAKTYQDAVAGDAPPALDQGVAIIDSPGKTPTRILTIKGDHTHIMRFPDGHEYMLNRDLRVKSDLLVRTKSGALVRMTMVDKPTKAEAKEQQAKNDRAAWKKASKKSTEASTSAGDDDTMASKKKSTKKTASKKSATKGEGTRISAYSGKKLYKKYKTNPRRPGSHSHTMLEKLKDGMTWDAFIALGAKPIDVRHDLNKGRLVAKDA